MNAIRSFVFAAAVSLSAAVPASAMTSANLASPAAPVAAPAAFVLAGPLLAGSDNGAESAAARAAEAYFDFDALITLGALAIAVAGLSAFAAFAARRRNEEEARLAEPEWRESVFRTMQADLAEFTESFRRAA